MAYKIAEQPSLLLVHSGLFIYFCSVFVFLNPIYFPPISWLQKYNPRLKNFVTYQLNLNCLFLLLLNV